MADVWQGAVLALALARLRVAEPVPAVLIGGLRVGRTAKKAVPKLVARALVLEEEEGLPKTSPLRKFRVPYVPLLDVAAPVRKKPS